MKILNIQQGLLATLLSLSVMTSGAVYAADIFPLDKKLQQCEMAFKKAKSGNMSQSEAWKARKEHKSLMREILSDLNKRNSEIETATGEVLSSEEIINNFKVMGRLLEMLVSEHPAETDEWGYPLY